MFPVFYKHTEDGMEKISFFIVLFGLTVTIFGCKDDINVGTCEFYRQKGYCMKVKWLAQKCKRTCRLCGCNDELNSAVCSSYKKRGYCVPGNGFGSKCLRTCDLCNPTTAIFTASARSTQVNTLPVQRTSSRPSIAVTSKPPSTTSKRRSSTVIEQRTTLGTGVETECGVSSIKSRVIGGSTSRLGQWPWQGMVIYKKISNCGATLISPEWVVTAAHCTYNKSAADFQVAFAKLHKYRSSKYEQKRSVKLIIQHENYRNPVRVYNDIALMKLSTPVLLNKYVNVVCLPAKGMSATMKDNCYISGWGKTMHPGFGSYELRHAKLNVLSQNECTQRNKHLAPVIDTMMCGANLSPKRQSACHGDSGGPFVCQNSSGKWLLQGTISWGSPVCKIQDGATVFTRILAYHDWIHKILSKANYIGY